METGPGRRYLVMGCAGFIGSHLTQALTARGCAVVGVDVAEAGRPFAWAEPA
jgi:nucleoside-diphosphate-sugar epimerase